MFNKDSVRDEVPLTPLPDYKFLTVYGSLSSDKTHFKCLTLWKKLSFLLNHSGVNKEKVNFLFNLGKKQQQNKSFPGRKSRLK